MHPDIAKHIFDVFLVDGEALIFTLITKFIYKKEQYLLAIDDDNEFLKYIMETLPMECIQEYTMTDLLDFNKLWDGIKYNNK